MSVDAGIELLEQERIKQVRYNFGLALDTRDWTLFRSLFTSDALGDFASFAGPDAGAVPADAIVAMFQGAFRPPAEELHTQQILSNIVVELDGTSATMTSYLQGHHQLIAEQGAEEATLRARYHDELVREDGDWRIRHTRLELISISGNPAVFAP